MEIGKSSQPSRNLATVLLAKPVVNLQALREELPGPQEQRRLKWAAQYYARTGRLQRVAQGVYAAIPPGVEAAHFQPDPYLVAAVLRTDAVLSHHAALDLLGQAHSVLQIFPYFTRSPRRLLERAGNHWIALSHPAALVRIGKTDFGVTTHDRRGERLRVTGPERTLVDCFDSPRWAGGLEELVESAAGFRGLDLHLLEAYLELLDQRRLDAAVGWFIETHPETAAAVEPFLRRLEQRAKHRPIYLEKGTRGGRFQKRWNLIVPENLAAYGKGGA